MKWNNRTENFFRGLCLPAIGTGFCIGKVGEKLNSSTEGGEREEETFPPGSGWYILGGMVGFPLSFFCCPVTLPIGLIWYYIGSVNDEDEIE